jgi:ABC-type transport system involved in multi-copper enzyme maturation permease subunit
MDFHALQLSLPLAQALTPGQSEFWLAKWASPFWFLGVGVLVGLVALALAALVFRGLSQIPAWEGLSRSPAGHAVAAAVSLLLTIAVWPWVRGQGFDGQEQVLVFLTLLLINAVVGWAVVFCPGRRSAETLWATLTEGAPSMLGFVALMVMCIGLLSTLLFSNPGGALASIPDLFQTGEQAYVKTIPAMPADVAPDNAPLVKVELPIDRELMTRFSVVSNRAVVFGDAEDPTQFRMSPKRVQPGEELTWNRETDGVPPIPLNADGLFVQNREVDPAEVTFVIETKTAVPESATILITGVCVFLVGLVFLLQQAVAPRASAVSLATFKNELGQPLFMVLLLLGTCLIVLFEFLSFNTFGEDIKLLKENGITVIMLLAAFQGVWSASSSISEEIEGRTALTVLSKPIQRRSFVIGKFLGIFWVVALLFVVLGLVELAAVAYKPIYEARENSLDPPIWQECHREMISTIPGLALGLMQATLLTAVSVALATRLPQLANISVCFGIYLVGHLASAIVSGANQGFEIVKFVAQLVSTVIPILEHFSMQAAIDAGNPITMSLLAGTLIYCLLYILLSMFLALLLFEDRDLA